LAVDQEIDAVQVVPQEAQVALDCRVKNNPFLPQVVRCDRIDLERLRIQDPRVAEVDLGMLGQQGLRAGVFVDANKRGSVAAERGHHRQSIAGAIVK